LFFPHLVHHVLAQVVVGHAELLPPVGQHLVDLTGIGAQAHEIKSGAKTRLIHQAKWSAPYALVKARLQHPDFAHVTGQLAATRDIADAGIEDVVNGVLQRRMRMLTL
jgi:hypothetical protein